MSLSDIITQSIDGTIQPAPSWSNLSVKSIMARVINTDRVTSTTPFQQIGGMFELIDDLTLQNDDVITGFQELDIGGWSSVDFNQATGVFSPPVKGKYMFTINLLCGNPSQVFAYARINGNKAIALEASLGMGQIVYSNLVTPTFSPPVDTDNRVAVIRSTFIFDLTNTDQVDFIVEADSGDIDIYKYAYDNVAILGSTSTLSIALVGRD